MTREQVQEAYEKYQKMVTECELLDMKHADAVATAYQIHAKLEHCERQCARAWTHYSRCLEMVLEEERRTKI